MIQEKTYEVTITADNVDQTIQVLDRESGQMQTQIGIVKTVPNEKFNSTLADLLTYCLDPAEDNYNSAFTDAEEQLASQYNAHLQRDNTIIEYVKDGQSRNQPVLSFNDAIRPNLEQIVYTKEKLGTKIQSIDFVMRTTDVGGRDVYQ